MARSQLNEIVALSTGGTPINGALVTVTGRDGTPVTVWADSTSTEILPQPLTTVNGQIVGWLDDGSYRLQIDPPTTGVVFSSQTAFVEIVNGGDLITSLAAKQGIADKDQPGGYAPLGADRKVPAANLPDPPDFTPYQTRAEKGQPSGYAGLDTGGHVLGNQLVGVPVFVQAAQPTNPPIPSVWIPLDGTGAPLPANQWQVFA